MDPDTEGPTLRRQSSEPSLSSRSSSKPDATSTNSSSDTRPEAPEATSTNSSSDKTPPEADKAETTGRRPAGPRDYAGRSPDVLCLAEYRTGRCTRSLCPFAHGLSLEEGWQCGKGLSRGA